MFDWEYFQELLKRAQTGDRDAQGELLEPHRGFLEQLAVRQTDARLKGRVDVADIVHETYLTALRSLHQFRGSTRPQFIGWLRAVHEHVVQNLIREHIVTQMRSVNCERPLAEQPATSWALLTDSTPSRNLMQAEVIMQLIHALDTLPVDQREAIRLRYFEQWKLDAIATHMQRSHDSVAGLLKRGLQALREQLIPDSSATSLTSQSVLSSLEESCP